MISAKLIKDLEKRGFSLEFPSYDSNDSLLYRYFETEKPKAKYSNTFIVDGRI